VSGPGLGVAGGGISSGGKAGVSDIGAILLVWPNPEASERSRKCCRLKGFRK